MINILFIIFTIGCHSKDVTSNSSHLNTKLLPSQNGAISIPRKLNEKELREFSKMFREKYRAISPPGNYQGAFVDALKVTVGQIPARRSQIIPVVTDVINNDLISCGPEHCKKTFSLDAYGIVPVFEKARIQLLRQLDNEPSSEKQSSLRGILGSLADDSTPDLNSAFEKALVVGKAKMPMNPVDESTLDLAKQVKESLPCDERVGIADYVMFYEKSMIFSRLSAIPAPGQTDVMFPGTRQPTDYDKRDAKFFLKGISKLPKSPGVVYRAVANAPQSFIDHLQIKAANQLSTGLFYNGAAAVLSSTHEPAFANKWLAKNPLLEIAKTDSRMKKEWGFDPVGKPLLLVINQKSGVGLVGQYPGQKEIVLPPKWYKVVRFENRDIPDLTERDPQWPNAAYVVYLDEE